MKANEEYSMQYGMISKEPNERLKVLTDLLSPRSILQLNKEIKRLKKIKWKTFERTFYLIPKATPRPRYSSSSRCFYVKGAADTKKIFRQLLKDEELPYIETACKLKIDCYFPLASSMTKVERVLAELQLIRHLSKPDWDNIGKTYSDVLEGIGILVNDSHIVDGQIRKFYSAKPRIEVFLTYQTEFDSKFNERKIKTKKGTGKL